MKPSYPSLIMFHRREINWVRLIDSTLELDEAPRSKPQREVSGRKNRKANENTRQQDVNSKGCMSSPGADTLSALSPYLFLGRRSETGSGWLEAGCEAGEHCVETGDSGDFLRSNFRKGKKMRKPRGEARHAWSSPAGIHARLRRDPRPLRPANHFGRFLALSLPKRRAKIVSTS